MADCVIESLHGGQNLRDPEAAISPGEIKESLGCDFSVPGQVTPMRDDKLVWTLPANIIDGKILYVGGVPYLFTTHADGLRVSVAWGGEELEDLELSISDTGFFALYKGMMTNMLRNPLTGTLVPVDQTLASGNNFDVFNKLVLNPYATYEYEGLEIDLGMDRLVTIGGRLYSWLGPGESGSNSPQLQLDYRTDQGSYSGFQEWGSGTVIARYLKFKMVNTAATGNIVLQQFEWDWTAK